MRRLFLLAVALMLIMPLAATAMAAPEPLARGMPKIQRFDFLLDCSCSMMMHHKHLGRSKLELAKQILRRVNDRIPELEYTGSIHTFGDNKQALAPQTYRREIFQNAFAPLKDTYEVFNRLTPTGDGINHWSNALYAGIPSPAAVIIMRGGENTRVPPSNPIRGSGCCDGATGWLPSQPVPKSHYALKRKTRPFDFRGAGLSINVGAGLRSHTRVCSIIGDEGLNFRVRNGAGCAPFSMDANKF